MPKRGINYKNAMFSLDDECWRILDSKKNWDGFNVSAHVRKAIKAYERRNQPQVMHWDGVDEQP